MRHHDVLLEHVYFAHTAELQKFKYDGYFSRFALRDSIVEKTFRNFAFQWDGTDFCLDNLNDYEDQEDICSTCFSSAKSQPLSMQSFNIIQEWFLDVPVESQMLLEQFISYRSSIRSKIPDQFLRQKLEKLYQIFDSLMHISNKMFVGIFQQSNTDVLLIEYKNINSVFRITSGAGITLSLDAAEEKLRTKAEDDLLYYNAFLKKHALTYCTAAGEVTTTLSLRQCHPILMLDNLVRFTYVKNPNPGATTSNQLCTLPITVQGLPKDASITEQWHKDDCTHTSNCPCKQPTPLKKEDVNRVLLKLSHRERDVKSQFSQLMAWGYTQLWRHMTGRPLKNMLTHKLNLSTNISVTVIKVSIDNWVSPTFLSLLTTICQQTKTQILGVSWFC